MALAQRMQELRTGFSPTFWVANTLELFERFAFYGSKAVLAYYLAEKVGLKDVAGTLTGIFSGVIYFFPPVAGVLVDKYGFRKTLMACFFVFCIGYFLIGLAGLEYGQQIMASVGRMPYMLAVLLLTALGGSLIKPCIVGTVAKTSQPSVKSLGFSIYYTLVNFGGAIGPLLALQVRENLGVEYVLIMSSFTSLLLFIGAWLFYEEPDDELETSEKKSFARVFGDMLLVFTNLRFITFLLIISGIWIMFWQTFYLIPFYGPAVLGFEEFELLETVDAITIICVTIPAAALVKKWKPITAMTIGFVIASAGWLLIGIVPAVWATVAGIAIYAVGEAMQTPRFYEYVSTLAPKGQTGTFMGFAFLPVSIGSIIAGILADWLRLNFLNTNPALMWYIVSGVGFGCTALMLLYNALVAPKAEQ